VQWRRGAAAVLVGIMLDAAAAHWSKFNLAKFDQDSEDATA